MELLKEILEIDDELKEFILKHSDLINENNFTQLYNEAKKAFQTPNLLWPKLTEILLEAGINPLQYMDRIPPYYLAYSDISFINIPDHIKYISDSAFEGCHNLKKIEIPESVESIGSYAFWDCDSLTSITIPSNVSSIGRGVFNCRDRRTKVLNIINNSGRISWEDLLSACAHKAKTIKSKYELNIKNSPQDFIEKGLQSDGYYLYRRIR